MLYINPKKNELGGYNPPQSTHAPGLVKFPDEFLAELVEWNGFVLLTIEGDSVVDVDPDVEAWETWKATVDESTDETTSDSSGDAVTWDELDTAYNEGVNGAYE